MDLAVLRDDMVDSLQHEAKGVVESDAVGLAMRTVPRHEFVDLNAESYADKALEHRGTRVLSPSMVARLVEALRAEDGDSVLVVGAGVGYTAAVLAEIVGEANVHAVDINRQLVYDARRNLADAGYGGVFVDCRNGADGLREYAPFDRILLEAAAVAPPRALVSQLADGGRLVMPRGASEQSLVAIEDDAARREAATDRPSSGRIVEHHGPVAFSPMLVEGEQAGAIERNRTAREDREHAVRNAHSRRGWEQEWIDWDGRL